MAGPSIAEDPETFQFRVKRAPVAKALIEFAKQSGISLSMPRISYRDGKTRFMSGSYTMEEGLERLLRGTDFTYKVVNPHSVRIIRRPKVIVQPVEVAHSVEAEFIPIQEILVSSLRRVDDMQKVPYAISAVIGVQQEHLRATSTNDIVHRIANIYATKQGVGRNKVVIRGLSDGAFSGRAQGLVSTYMDNARLTYNAPDPGLKLIDVDRIEVLRGPQGTLYGSGALSGLYRVVSRRPSTVETELSVSGSYAWTKEGDPIKEVSAIANLPVIEDKFAIRTSAYFEDDGGYIDDERLDLKDVNAADTWGGRVAGLVQLNDTWQLTVGANYQKHKSQDTNYYNSRRRRFQRDNYIQEPRTDEMRQFYLTLDADFGWAELTSNTSWMQRDIEATFDGSLAVPKLLGLEVTASPFTEKRDISTFTNETHLTSASGGRFEWILGTFYSRRDETVFSTLTVPGASRSDFIEDDEIYREELTDDLREYAVFGELTYFFNEQVSVTGGLRWFHYNDKASSLVKDIAFISQGGQTASGTQKKSGVTPKIVLSYHINDENLVYGQISQGYRVGGINLSGPRAIDLVAVEAGTQELPSVSISPIGLVLDNFQSDKLTNYEIGYKTQLFNGDLTINSAVYYADWREIQALEYQFTGLPEIANVGDARVIGAEMEFYYRPTHKFELQGNISVSDSEITRSNFSFGVADGDSLPGAPNFSAGLSGRYEFDLMADITASISADYVYVGGANLLFNKYRSPKTDPYHLTNLRLAFHKGRWQLTLFANNLFDSKANSFAFGNPFSLEDFFLITDQNIVAEPNILEGGTIAGTSLPFIEEPIAAATHFTPLRPRTVGIELSWRF